MKLCDTCIYRNENEYHKPCVVYRDDCEYYEKERGDMTREEAIRIAQGLITDFKCESETMVEFCNTVIEALEQEPCTNIPFLLHKEFGCPLDECVKAYEKAIEYLRSKAKIKG